MKQLPEFSLTNQEVAIVEPCVTEEGAIMIDFNLFKYLSRQEIDTFTRVDFVKVKEMIDKTESQFSKVQFSARLGMCKLVGAQWEIIIARSGRIVVRRAKSKNIIEQAVNVAFHLIDGSLE